MKKLNEVVEVKRDVNPGQYRCVVRRLLDQVERVVQILATDHEEAAVEAAYCRTS